MTNIKCIGFYWQTCDFPFWERVKYIVPVYNAHTSYQIKNLGKILCIIDFFQKSMHIIDTNYFFLEIFKVKRGAHYAPMRIMQP
jgi:hypothetical protein